MANRSARGLNGSGRPDSRPSSRSRVRMEYVSQDDPPPHLPPPHLPPPPPPPPSASSSTTTATTATTQHSPTTIAAAIETPPTSIQFVSSGHSNKTLATLNDLRLNGELSDIVLKVGEEQVSSHKLILSANSPYFRAMFSSSYSESTQAEVKVHEVSFSALESLVQYFYTSKIHISTSNVQELLAASSMLQISPVSDACCEFMRRHLGASNCLGVRTFADMHSCSELRKVADDFARRNFSTVVGSEDFLKLEVEQLMELFSADDLCVESEKMVFEAMLVWIKHDPAERSKFIVNLLEKVRIPLLPAVYMFDHVIKAEAIRENLRAMTLVLEAMEHHMIPERRKTKPLSDWTKARVCNHNTQMILAVGGMGRREPAPSIELYDTSTKQWRTHSQMASGRWGAGLIAMATKESEEAVYLVGGSNESSRLSSVQFYITSTDQWTSVTDMSSARNGVGVVSYDGLLYAIGGFDGVSPLKSVEQYNPLTDQWTSLPSMTTKRFGLGACACEGMIYAIGGQDSSVLNTVECYNISTKSWTTLSPMSVCRKFPGAECLSGRIYAIGGADTTNCRLSTVEEYISSLNQWVVVAPLLTPRSGLGTAVLGGHIYVVGGHDGNVPLSSMERFDPLVNEWTVQPNMSFGRDCVGVAVVGMSHGSGGGRTSQSSPLGGAVGLSDSPAAMLSSV